MMDVCFKHANRCVFVFVQVLPVWKPVSTPVPSLCSQRLSTNALHSPDPKQLATAAQILTQGKLTLRCSCSISYFAGAKGGECTEAVLSPSR